MIRAAIFDLDGLLIDSEPFWQDAEIEVFQSIGVPLTRELCVQTMGLILHEVIDHWARIYPWDEARHPRREVAERVMAGVIERMQARGRPLPGVKATIDFLAAKGLPLAVASSSYKRVIDAALGALGIADRFAVVRSAESEALGKPHPGVFLTTARELDVPAVHCLVFEDSLNGLVAAKAARMRCVAVPDGVHYDDPRFALADVKLRSLEEFDEGVWERLYRS